MNGDDSLDPLNAGCIRANLIMVNRRGAPKEQLQATGNQVPAREMSDPEDEVVETSDNEELAFDHALQQPSYWLAPSLYAPYLQTAHSKPPCLSQHAIGSSSAQPSTVRFVLYVSGSFSTCLS